VRVLEHGAEREQRNIRSYLFLYYPITAPQPPAFCFALAHAIFGPFAPIFPENDPLLSSASQARCSANDNIRQFMHGLIVIKTLLFYLD